MIRTEGYTRVELATFRVHYNQNLMLSKSRNKLYL